MIASVAEGVMVGFILAIIVAGFFGPWVISLMLAAVCLGCLGMRSANGGGES